MPQGRRLELWNARMLGEAELAQAEQNRQIQIAQSRVKAEAAMYEAQDGHPSTCSL
jgi:hypothetical protein